MTVALLEAQDGGADNPVLLSLDGSMAAKPACAGAAVNLMLAFFHDHLSMPADRAEAAMATLEQPASL